jgi:hypothetical protein
MSVTVSSNGSALFAVGFANLHVGDHLCSQNQRSARDSMGDASQVPTIVALSLLAEPGEEGLAVGQSQYCGTRLRPRVRLLGCVPLALDITVGQHSSGWSLDTGAQSFR